jgi:hypothetical protein
MFLEDGRRVKVDFTMIVLVCVSAVLLCAGPLAFAQNPESLPPKIAAELARAPKPPLSNQVVGIDIDQFIGNPLLSPVRVTHDVIYERSILSHGDPYHPGVPGKVFEYWKDLSLGTVRGYARSPIVQMPDEQCWYVESGKGRLDNGNEYWDLHQGIAVLIPANAPHRIENTTEEPIQMLMLTWSRDNRAIPRRNILVRDVHYLPLPAQPAHWSYFGTFIFASKDGLNPNEVIAIVYQPPMTIAEPHAHIPHQAEVWVKLPPYSSYLMLGSEVRDMPPNVAFLSPPNGQTVHSVVNLIKDKTQAYLYFAHWVWTLSPPQIRPNVEPKPLNELH